MTDHRERKAAARLLLPMFPERRADDRCWCMGNTMEVKTDHCNCEQREIVRAHLLSITRLPDFAENPFDRPLPPEAE